MKETIYAKLKDELHNELHRAGVEHPHAGKRSCVDESWGESQALEIEIEYDEQVALSLFDISTDHSFRLNRTFKIPIKNEEGKYEVKYDVEATSYVSTTAPHIPTKEVNVLKMAIDRATKTYQWSQNIDDLIREVKILKDEADQGATAAIAEVIPEYEAKVAQAKNLLEEKEAAKKAKEEAEKAAELAAEELFKTQATAWAEEHGSERIKKGLAKGYKCKQIFIREFSEVELGGGWIFDWGGDISTKARSCPTLTALDLCEELESNEWLSEVTIKWLPKGFDELLSDEERYEEEESPGFEAIEAKMLGYYLYKRV